MIIHVCPVCSSQIAYLENLLKVYNEEICRLQQAELSLTDMEAEDSLYIQEHKLKRKVSLQCGAARWLPLSNTDIKAVKCKCLRQPEWQLLTPPSRVLLLFFPDDEDLWKTVWTKGLQHTNRPSHWTENHLQKHSLPWDQQEGELHVVGATF